MIVQGIPIRDQPHLALCGEHAIVGQLALCPTVGHFLAGRAFVAWQIRGRASRPTNHSGHAHADVSTAEFRKRDGAEAAALASHAGLSDPQLVDVEVEVAIPVDGVHRQIQMSIEQQHPAASSG